MKTHLQLKIPPFLKNLRTRNMNYTYKSLSKINSLKKNFLSSPIQKWITHYFMTSTYDQSSCNLNIQSTVLKLLYIYWNNMFQQYVHRPTVRNDQLYETMLNNNQTLDQNSTLERGEASNFSSIQLQLSLFLSFVKRGKVKWFHYGSYIALYIPTQNNYISK